MQGASSHISTWENVNTILLSYIKWYLIKLMGTSEICWLICITGVQMSHYYDILTPVRVCVFTKHKRGLKCRSFRYRGFKCRGFKRRGFKCRITNQISTNNHLVAHIMLFIVIWLSIIANLHVSVQNITKYPLSKYLLLTGICKTYQNNNPFSTMY